MSDHSNQLFYNKQSKNTYTDSVRVLNTPSYFAKSTLLYIQEIGKLKSLQGHISSREKLDSFLFLIVLSGKGNLTYEGKTYQLSSGDHAFVDCNKSYSHQSSEEQPWELMWIHFNGAIMGRYYLYFSQKYEDAVFRTSGPSPYIELLQQMMELIGEHSAVTELKVSNLLNNLVTQILIYNSTENEISNSVESKINDIKDYIDSHLNDKLTLDNLSRQFYISKFYLSREFKRVTGSTINDYTTNKRINRAKHLLRFSDLRIEEISQACGVEDSSYFNRVFKSAEGMTAREYRKKWRGFKTDI